jgi:stage II sporulation protein D
MARGATLFDVFADTRSQVYGGIAAETPEGTAAVAATAGQVLLNQGQVAETFFHSSSGGRTAPVTEQWPDSKAVPYLVSVADPYDIASPWHDWGPVAFTAGQVAKALKLPGAPLDLTVRLGASRHATTVVATDADGTQSEIRGTDFRFGLGLRSTAISIGTLSLVPPTEPVPYGQPAELQGSVHGVDGAALEQRAPGGAWTPGPELAPAPDGSFSVTVSPLAPTDYRLVVASPHAPPVATAPARVPVVAAVTLQTAAAGLVGTVQPARAGVRVQLRPVEGGPVRTATTDATGAFSFAAPPPGAYRATALGGSSDTVLVS